VLGKAAAGLHSLVIPIQGIYGGWCTLICGHAN
jgi:hypothetical protein